MAAALAAAKSRGREEAVSASRASSLQSPRHHCTSRISGFNHPQIQSLRNLGAGLFSVLPSSQRSETRWRDNLRDSAQCGPVSNLFWLHHQHISSVTSPPRWPRDRRGNIAAKQRCAHRRDLCCCVLLRALCWPSRLPRKNTPSALLEKSTRSSIPTLCLVDSRLHLSLPSLFHSPVYNSARAVCHWLFYSPFLTRCRSSSLHGWIPFESGVERPVENRQ
jgi:hypothetical protein